MARSGGKARRKENDEDASQSYEEYSGGGARPPGPGGRRNVAAGAQEYEPEDYNEQNRRNVTGEAGSGIQTGNYDEDYGPGAKGHRHPQFHNDEPAQKDRGVLRRHDADGEVTDTQPSGAWTQQRRNARLKGVQSGKMRARARTGRGVGVTRKNESGQGTSRARKPAKSGPSSSRGKPGRTHKAR